MTNLAFAAQKQDGRLGLSFTQLAWVAITVLISPVPSVNHVDSLCRTVEPNGAYDTVQIQFFWFSHSNAENIIEGLSEHVWPQHYGARAQDMVYGVGAVAAPGFCDLKQTAPC